jgi:hypothetical protein
MPDGRRVDTGGSVLDEELVRMGVSMPSVRWPHHPAPECDCPTCVSAVPWPAARPSAQELTRPIVGVENRTGQEVFEIMADRIRMALA